MYSKKLWTLLAFIILFPIVSSAQNLNIMGDTIKVSSEIYATIVFPDEVQSVAPQTSRQKDYLLPIVGKMISVKPAPGVKKPISPCPVIIEEGTEDDKRSHLFIIVFMDKSVVFNGYHDLSSKKKIENRIAELNRQAAQPSQPATPQQNAAVNVSQPQTVVAEDAGAGNAGQAQQTTTVSTEAESFTLGDLVIKTSDFKEKVHQRMDAFKDYLELLGSHKGNTSDYISRAMALFNNNEDVIIQVSSKSSKDPIPSKVRQYLQKIAGMRYSGINITNTQVMFLGNLHQTPDGKWRGSVSYLQHFEGFKGDRHAFAYADNTKKTQEIIVEINNDVSQGNSQKTWKVFLGNLTVSPK